MRLLRLQRAGTDPGSDSRRTSGADPLADLLERAGRGDEQAFADLYDELAGVVHGVVLRTVRDPAQSEEVTQEVFVELWRLAARHDAARGSVRAWVTTVAHRRAIDRVRSEQAARDRVTREGGRSGVGADVERDEVADTVVDAAATSFDRARVRRALDRLTPLQRETVELAYYGGHTYREVASLLGVPEGTVKTRIRDGMIRLRDELGGAS